MRRTYRKRSRRKKDNKRKETLRKRVANKRTTSKRKYNRMKRRTHKSKPKSRPNFSDIDWSVFKMKPLPKSKSTTKSKSRAKSEVDKYAESKVKYQGHLITDVPIDDNYHLGILASKKHLYDHYADFINFKRYFNKIIKKLPKKILYFPSLPLIKEFKSKFDIKPIFLDLEKIKKYKDRRNLSKLGSETAVEILPLMNRFSGLTKELKKGMKQNYRFICIYLGLTFKKSGHANIVLYDTKNKVVELFEPHGGRDKTNPDAHYKDVTHILKKYIEYMFPKYKFIEPKAYMPKLLQRDIDNFRGSCLSICMMYLHYKLLNPNIPSKVIVNRIKHNGKAFLNRYIKYIENTVKNKKTKHKSKSIKTV